MVAPIVSAEMPTSEPSPGTATEASRPIRAWAAGVSVVWSWFQAVSVMVRPWVVGQLAHPGAGPAQGGDRLIEGLRGRPGDLLVALVIDRGGCGGGEVVDQDLAGGDVQPAVADGEVVGDDRLGIGAFVVGGLGEEAAVLALFGGGAVIDAGEEGERPRRCDIDGVAGKVAGFAGNAVES
jgi:hypothetical protein